MTQNCWPRSAWNIGSDYWKMTQGSTDLTTKEQRYQLLLNREKSLQLPHERNQVLLILIGKLQLKNQVKELNRVLQR